ncbi:MAG: GNAT family N-acetyltransferase [Anaerolineales bacterium]|nr:GNAT family N-acetyltransferase [Anaerolineales bacterium]
MISVKTSPITMVPFDYSQAHYEIGVGLHNATWPEVPDTVADWRRRDEHRVKEHYYASYLIRNEDNQQFVGVGFIMHTTWTFHPQRFFIFVDVLPEYQGRGIGKQAYEFLMAELEPLEPLELETESRADRPRSLRFLADRGFTIKTREYSSRLDLASFDPAGFGDYEGRMREQGIEIIDLNELKRREPDYLRIVYDLDVALIHDVPWHHEKTPLAFEPWSERFLSSEDRIDECYLLAVDGDQYVGLTMLFSNKAKDDTLYTGLTGVLPSHRRRGIAMALKLQALGYAKANFRTSDGAIPSVVTENEENNPMFTINERLGFKRQPDWLMYSCKLGDIEAGTREN